jgi:site-specific recombinase XerD
LPFLHNCVVLLTILLERQPRTPDQRLFVKAMVNRSEPRGRFKLAAYVKAAAKSMPKRRTKHVTPHAFRHATAVHLTSAGVDVTVIRS